MSTYDDASLVMIPSGYKTGTVFSQKPMSTDGQLTFTRSNDTATRVGPDGLIEKVRTNVLLQSNTFSNASWTKAGQGVASVSVVTPNYTTDPFGGNNAWRFQCNLNGGTTSADRSWIYSSFSALAQSTISIYVKLNTAGTKNVVFSDSGGSITTLTSTEWVRISSTSTGAAGEFRFGLIGGSSSDTLDCSIAFAQAEAGDIATDYIPTTTTAVSVGPVANVPRLDYLNSSCPRLLLEPQRTSLITFSEYFDNAAWYKVNATVTANAAVSPDGYTNADQFNFNASSDSSCYQPLSGSSAAYSISIFAKYVSGGKYLYIFSPLNSDSSKVWFDIEAGTVANQVSGFTGAIQDYGNGWFRCTLTNTSNRVLNYIQFGISSTSSSRTLSASSVTYFYGAQVEAGAYATSYIPTLAAAVTRGADSCSKTGISSLIGQTEGTVFLDAIFPDVSTGQVFMELTGSGTDVNFQINGTTLYFYSATNWSISTTILANTRYKIAGAYKGNDIVFYVNGVQIGTDSSATISAKSNLYINTLSTGAYLTPMQINQALLFPTRLDNATLASLTTL